MGLIPSGTIQVSEILNHPTSTFSPESLKSDRNLVSRSSVALSQPFFICFTCAPLLIFLSTPYFANAMQICCSEREYHDKEQSDPDIHAAPRLIIGHSTRRGADVEERWLYLEQFTFLEMSGCALDLPQWVMCKTSGTLFGKAIPQHRQPK